MRMSGPAAASAARASGARSPGHDGPRADRGRRLRTAGRNHGVRRKRQRGAQDEGVMTDAVVAGTTALLHEAERTIERAGALVLLVHLKGERGRAEHLRVVGHTGHQARGDALAPARGVHDDLLDLKVRPREHASRKADDGPLVVRDPPAAARLGELLVEHALRPRRVRRALVGRGLERRHCGGVVERHRAKLQVNARERVIHTGKLHRRRRLEAQARALGLLGVGEARVDGQDERRGRQAGRQGRQARRPPRPREAAPRPWDTTPPPARRTRSPRPQSARGTWPGRCP